MTTEYKKKIDFILKKMKNQTNVTVYTGRLSDCDKKELRKVFSTVQTDSLGYTLFKK